MGLLDQFNLDDPQTMGLLSAAAQMAQMSGPSLRPTNLGQILGGTFGAYSQSMAQSKKQKQDEELFKLQMLHAQQGTERGGMELQQMRESLARQGKIRDGIAGLHVAGAGPAASTPAMGAQQSMQTMFGGQAQGSPDAPDWLPPKQSQAAPRRASATGQNLTEMYANRLLAEADVYSKNGDFEGADKRLGAAAKLMPEVKTIETAMHDGLPVRVITYKDGREQVSAFGARPDMVEMDLGGVRQWVDKNTVGSGQQFKKTNSPDALLTDARARDFNATLVEGNNIKRDENRKVADMTKASQVASFDTMIGTLDRLGTHPGLSRSVGVIGALPTMPGTESANFQAELNTFQSQAFIPMVAQLKGMGALSDAEGKKLTAAVGALDPKMGEPAFRASVQRIRDDMEAARARVSGGAARKPSSGGAWSIQRVN